MTRFITNSPELEINRKALRKYGTPAEATLWKHLKNRQLAGRKFRRQFSIDNHILDFYCVEEMVNVELDGAGHYTTGGQMSDFDRDAYLESLGVKVLRFENKLIFDAIDSVLEEIKNQFKRQDEFKRGMKRKKHQIGNK